MCRFIEELQPGGKAADGIILVISNDLDHQKDFLPISILYQLQYPLPTSNSLITTLILTIILLTVIDSLIVALDIIVRDTQSNPKMANNQKRLFLVTDASSPMNLDSFDIVISQMIKREVKLNIM